MTIRRVDHADERPLRVVINASAATLGGGLTYLVSQCLYLQDRADVTIIVAQRHQMAVAEQLERANVISSPAWSNLAPLRLAWEQLVLPLRLRGRADVLYSTGSLAVVLAPVPQVVVFQNAHLFASSQERRARRPLGVRARLRHATLRRLARLSVRRAEASVAISRTLMESIRLSVGPRPERLWLVESGFNEWGEPSLAPPPEWELPSAYALFIGNDYPHKDWDGLTRMWREHNLDVPLVMAGLVSGERLRRLGLQSPTGPVTWIGAVSDRRHLRGLLERASIAIVHSTLEAFPLTPFEAMSLGVPVVASGIPAHRDVCGPAALFYEPTDGEDLRSCVARVLADEAVRQRLIRAGMHRKTGYSWAGNADRLVEIFRCLTTSDSCRGRRQEKRTRR